MPEQPPQTPEAKPTFRELLIHHMTEKDINSVDLERKTGIPRGNIRNWRTLKGSIPRGIEDTVTVADGLALEDDDRNTFIDTWRQEHRLHYPSQSIAVGTFAGWLKAHRLVSQPKQARQLGVTLDVYHEWEAGTTVPDDHKVRVAAIVMKADVEEGLRLAHADGEKSVRQRVADVRAARGAGSQRR